MLVQLSFIDITLRRRRIVRINALPPQERTLVGRWLHSRWPTKVLIYGLSVSCQPSDMRVCG